MAQQELLSDDLQWIPFLMFENFEQLPTQARLR